MHAQRPLQGNNGALDWLNVRKRKHQNQRRPNDLMNPQRPIPVVVHSQKCGNADVTDDEHDEISGHIIGAVMMHWRCAYGTVVSDF